MDVTMLLCDAAVLDGAGDPERNPIAFRAKLPPDSDMIGENCL